MGFQITTDISSKTELVFFLFKVSFKRKHKGVLKGWFLSETNNKVTKITYKEKFFLEFLDHWAQVPYTKMELRSLESFPRIRDLTYIYFPNRCGTDASP